MITYYLLVMVVSMAIIVGAVVCGKKLRDNKDAKDVNSSNSKK